MKLPCESVRLPRIRPCGWQATLATRRSSGWAFKWIMIWTWRPSILEQRGGPRRALALLEWEDRVDGKPSDQERDDPRSVTKYRTQGRCFYQRRQNRRDGGGGQGRSSDRCHQLPGHAWSDRHSRAFSRAGR